MSARGTVPVTTLLALVVDRLSNQRATFEAMVAHALACMSTRQVAAALSHALVIGRVHIDMAWDCNEMLASWNHPSHED